MPAPAHRAPRRCRRNRWTKGPATIEGVRKQLEGRWTPLSLTMHDDAGHSTPIDADGQLVSDAFRNMEVE